MPNVPNLNFKADPYLITAGELSSPKYPGCGANAFIWPTSNSCAIIRQGFIYRQNRKNLESAFDFFRCVYVNGIVASLGYEMRWARPPRLCWISHWLAITIVDWFDFLLKSIPAVRCENGDCCCHRVIIIIGSGEGRRRRGAVAPSEPVERIILNLIRFKVIRFIIYHKSVSESI